MARFHAAALLLTPLLLAASAPVQSTAEPIDRALERARVEQRAAAAEAARLGRAAEEAQGEAARLRAQQLAAAQSIQAAEARITAADLELRLASANLNARRRSLEQAQQPISSLLAGVALMAERPPLIALADRTSTDELVKVRMLLDATLPTMRRQMADLAGQLREGERLERAAAAARAELLAGREELVARRNQFAALERRALQSATTASRQALSAGDVAIAAEESVERLHGSGAAAQAAAALASTLASAPPAPPRPVSADSPRPRVPFNYQLPAAAPVTAGFGAVSPNGVRSRGITLGTSRGAAVVAPAAGQVRFAGPFRDYDGVLIIDHGGGWVSLMVNVATTLRPGSRVGAGDAVGRATGHLSLELSRNGRRTSPALIAG